VVHSHATKEPIPIPFHGVGRHGDNRDAVPPPSRRRISRVASRPSMTGIDSVHEDESYRPADTSSTASLRSRRRRVAPDPFAHARERPSGRRIVFRPAALSAPPSRRTGAAAVSVGGPSPASAPLDREDLCHDGLPDRYLTGLNQPGRAVGLRRRLMSSLLRKRAASGTTLGSPPAKNPRVIAWAS